MMKLTSIAILLAVSVQAQVVLNDRYKKSEFTVLKMSDVLYSPNTPNIGDLTPNETEIDPKDLVMDIYLPDADTFNLKPAVICAHGGGFVAGSKDNQDIVAFCDSLAKKGYVAVTIQYRLGINLIDGKSPIRAVYRAIQDGRSAVRFLRANATTFGIDTTNIYMLGSSAGAFIGLHNLYVRNANEIPSQVNAYQWLFQTAPDLGPLDTGLYMNHSGNINGLISLWGGLYDINSINPSEDFPVLLVHGKNDIIVYYDKNGPFLNLVPSFPDVYGSKRIHERLDSLGIDHETYFVDGEGHEFYGVTNGNFGLTGPNDYWDTVNQKVVDFCYGIHAPKANFTYSKNGLHVSYLDQSTKGNQFQWDFGDGTFSTSQSPQHSYSSPGTYTVTQYVQSINLSWDSITSVISVVANPVGIERLNHNSIQIKKINESFEITVPNDQNVGNVSVYNNLGQLIYEKRHQNSSVVLENLGPTILFIQLEDWGFTRKVY
ncbi:MAG: carboxylesterase family protein [Flavobacteriales bacterium]|nr:carboxylesterase family protein [Flavobacteriales bacterium]